MAIYHASVKVFNRTSGHSSVAAAAYRAGEKLLDERRGKTHDYSRKQDVDCALILLPDGAPAWASNRESLWNAVEAVEKRKDAQLCREVEVAIPVELDKRAQRNLVLSYVRESFVDKGMIADIAFHGLDSNNPHAHILHTMRRFHEGVLANKERVWNDRALLLEWRKKWEVMSNNALAAAGSSERIDSRSYRERGINKVATRHLGKRASAMERRGIRTRIGGWNRDAKKLNKEIEQVGIAIAKILKIKTFTQPTNKFNELAERAHISLRLAKQRWDENFSDWLKAGYWTVMNKKLKKTISEQQDRKKPTDWVKPYKIYIRKGDHKVVEQIALLKSALASTNLEYKISQEKYQSTSPDSKALTVCFVECKKSDQYDITELIDNEKNRIKELIDHEMENTQPAKTNIQVKKQSRGR